MSTFIADDVKIALAAPGHGPSVVYDLKNVMRRLLESFHDQVNRLFQKSVELAITKGKLKESEEKLKAALLWIKEHESNEVKELSNLIIK